MTFKNVQLVIGCLKWSLQLFMLMIMADSVGSSTNLVLAEYFCQFQYQIQFLQKFKINSSSQHQYVCIKGFDTFSIRNCTCMYGWSTIDYRFRSRLYKFTCTNMCGLTSMASPPLCKVYINMALRGYQCENNYRYYTGKK